MAYDEALAERVRAHLDDAAGVIVERKMFGGLAFMLDGNMCVGISGDELMVRIDPDEHEAALDEPGVRPFDLTGRPMSGWVLVASHALATEDGLGRWVNRGVAFASTLKPK